MKTLKKMFVFMIAMSALCIGIIPSLFGMIYFISMSPSKDWINFLKSVPEDRKWVVAMMFLICGMFTAVYPLWNFLMNYKDTDDTKLRQLPPTNEVGQKRKS